MKWGYGPENPFSPVYWPREKISWEKKKKKQKKFGHRLDLNPPPVDEIAN